MKDYNPMKCFVLGFYFLFFFLIFYSLANNFNHGVKLYDPGQFILPKGSCTVDLF